MSDYMARREDVAPNRTTDEQKIQAIRDYIKDHSEDELLYSDAPAMLENLRLILGEEVT